MKHIFIIILFFSTSAVASKFYFEMGNKENFESLIRYFDETSVFYNCEINIKKENGLYHIYIHQLLPTNIEAVLTMEPIKSGKFITSLPSRVIALSHLDIPEYRLVEYFSIRTDYLGEPIEVKYTKVENVGVRRVICTPEL